MPNDADDFLVEYLYNPAPDAEERLAQAWDLILELILKDYEKGKKRIRNAYHERDIPK
jgi:hypothetical protein